MSMYSKQAADPTAKLSNKDLIQHMIPLILLTYLPPVIGRERAVLQQGGVLNNSNVVLNGTMSAALRGGLALVLRSLSSSEDDVNILGLVIEGDEEQR